MTALEFVIVLAWVLAPGFLLGVAILAVSHRRNPGRPIGRTVGAAFALAFISVCVALGLMFFAPAGLGRYVGLRDTPFMWAPFAFIAAALAMPVALMLDRASEKFTRVQANFFLTKIIQLRTGLPRVPPT